MAQTLFLIFLHALFEQKQAICEKGYEYKGILFFMDAKLLAWPPWDDFGRQGSYELSC